MRTLIWSLAMVLLAGSAPASEFCGANGMVKLSFTPGPDITGVREVEPGEGGLTMVTVHAILDDVATVEGPGGRLLAIGGFECALGIEGAEPLAVKKRILVPYRDFGPEPTQVWAGFDIEGQRIDQGPLTIVEWTVTFQGEIADVRFGLDRAGLLSCKDLAGCDESNASALYVGAIDVKQQGFMFGAGYTPAVLNPTGEPDLDPVPCTTSVAEAGIFTP
jgi:hypothetical protein